MSYDDYDEYDNMNSHSSGSSDHSGEDWDSQGFSIEDAQENVGEDREMSAEELIARFGEDKISPDPAMGMATAKDLLLGRLDTQSESVRAGVKAALMGQLKPTKMFDQNAIDDAVFRYSFVTGEDPRTSASRIKHVPVAPIQHIVSSGMDYRVAKTIQAKPSGSDMNIIMSMIGVTADSYLEAGPGSNLPGNNAGNSKRERKELSEYKEAMGYIHELSDLYIRQATIGHSNEGNKRYMVVEGLTERLINQNFFEPNEHGPDRSLLPVPNEVRVGDHYVTGLVPTLSNTWDTTGMGRVEYSMKKEGMSEAEQMANFPNLRRSLFPEKWKVGKEAFTRTKKQSQDLIDDALYKANFARRVLRQQLPTNRDESSQQQRNYAFDLPYGDQAEKASLRNEASILDLDRYQPDLKWDQGKLTASQIAQGVGAGADSGGMYGEKSLSEVDRYVQARVEGGSPYDESDVPELPGSVTYADTDLGRYQQSVASRSPNKQGSEAWLAEREGLVTASGIKELKGKSRDEYLLSLIGESDNGFIGNSYSEDGNRAEAGTIRSFLGKEGKGLIYEEAYFERGTGDLEGIAGISPDGRLYNADGSSRGLLEVKYLTDKSMVGSAERFMEQMQFQMLITGESQVDYYARSSDSNKSMHTVVKADAVIQEGLKKRAMVAKAESLGLSVEQVDEMKHRLDRSTSKSVPSTTLAGEEARYNPAAPQKEFVMSYVKPIEDAHVNRAGAIAHEKMLAQQQPLANSHVNALGAQQHRQSLANMQPMADSHVMAQNAELHKEMLAQGNPMADSHVNAMKNFEAAADRAAGKLDNMTSGLQRAIAGLAKLGEAAMDGNESGMDEVRLGAKVGLATANVRGLRESLVENGLSEAGATSSILTAGRMADKFNAADTAAAEYTRLLTGIAKSTVPGVSDVILPGNVAMQGLDAQQLLATFEALMIGQSAEFKQELGKISGYADLTVSDGRSDLLGVDSMIDDAGLRNFQEGTQLVRQSVREVKEFAGSGSYATGVAASAMPGGQYLAKPLAKILSAVNPATLAKVGPSLAAGAVPVATRAIFGIQDNNSATDRSLDIAEFALAGAGAGALLGSLAGPPGAAFGGALGGVLGAGVGVANEVDEYFRDRISPASGIGLMSHDAKNKDGIINNVTVDVNVSKDLVTTEVDVNGELDIDQENTFGTGG